MLKLFIDFKCKQQNTSLDILLLIFLESYEINWNVYFAFSIDINNGCWSLSALCVDRVKTTLQLLPSDTCVR